MWWIPCIIISAWLVAGIFAYAIKKHTYKIHYERCRPRGHTSKNERYCCYCIPFGLIGLIVALDYKRYNLEPFGLCWKMPKVLLANPQNRRR
ncbi:MAG: hypothetical protein WC242_00375 [Candidatus Paceibacterota bacterium]